MKKFTEAQANKVIRDTENLLSKRKKRLDISNALSYIERVIKITKGKIKMNDKNTKQTSSKSSVKKKVSAKLVLAMLIAAPLIVLGVSNIVTSNIPYASYVLGGVVALAVLSVVFDEK